MSEFMMQKYLELQLDCRNGGQTLAEYALLLALIAIVIIVVLGFSGRTKSAQPSKESQPNWVMSTERIGLQVKPPGVLSRARPGRLLR